MVEDIRLNVNAINNHYIRYGLDQKIHILMRSIIKKLYPSIEDSILLLLDTIWTQELKRYRSVNLSKMLDIFINFDSFKKYLKSINISTKQIALLKNNENKQQIIYNRIIESPFLATIENLEGKDKTFIKNEILEQKLKEIDDEMNILIQKYNQNRQIQDNIYYDINQNRVKIEVNDFWKVIDHKVLPKYRKKAILGFSNTYQNHHGYLFIEDYGKRSKEVYDNWCNRSIKLYNKKEGIEIIKKGINKDKFFCYYKKTNKDYYTYIETKWNSYNHHIYKFIKSYTKDFLTEHGDLEISSFMVQEELDYKPIEKVVSKELGTIIYKDEEEKYIGIQNNISFSLHVSINDKLKETVKKAEQIYKNLETILLGISNTIHLSNRIEVIEVDVYESYYVLKMKNKNTYKEFEIKIDQEGNVSLNNVNL